MGSLELLELAARMLPDDARMRAIVFGSTPMALAGLPRPPRDLDLFVPPELYERLRRRGVPEQRDPDGAAHLALDPRIEVWCSFPGVSWKDVATRARLDPRAHGMRVADLADVRAYKLALARPSDLADVALIEGLLGS